MAIKRLIDETPSTGEVPFLNKITVGFEDLIGTCWFVREIVDCSTGYLIITNKFKAFLFNGTTQHGYLRQALNVWTEKNEVSYPLFVEVLKNKKVALAIDDEALDGSWTREGNKYLQSQNPLEQNGSEEETSNPLLPPTQPLVSKSKRKRPESSTPYPTTIGH